jgi:hypothetical protein
MAQPIPKTDFEDPVLRALASAPVVPMTPEEQALLAEADFDGPRISHADVMKSLAERPDAE